MVYEECMKTPMQTQNFKNSLTALLFCFNAHPKIKKTNKTYRLQAISCYPNFNPKQKTQNKKKGIIN